MKKYTTIITAIVVIASAALGGQWNNTQWNQGVKIKALTGGQFYSDFPQAPGHINAISKSQGATALGSTITVKLRVKKLAGNPQFHSLDPGPAPPALLPNVRPMLQVKNDDYYTEDNRWWPTGANCVFLKADNLTITYTIKVKPALWSNVYGKLATSRLSRFRKALKKIGNLNLAFGGGNSFTHGLNIVNGKARFELISCTVTQ